MTSSRLILRNTVVVALQQVALTAVLFLLIVGWLHIPDANPFEVLISIVLVLLIAVIGGAGESAIALRVAGRPIILRSLIPGTVAVIVGAVLWYAISLGVDHLSAKTVLWAGYLNSRFPSSLRSLFSFEHLFQWSSWLGNMVCWGTAGLLTAAAFVVISRDAFVKGLRAILRSWRYWLSVLLFAVVGGVLTGKLMGWTPGHGLRVEAFSLMARMALVIVLNAATIGLLLQAMANAVVRGQSIGMDEPSTSQPRTAEMP